LKTIICFQYFFSIFRNISLKELEDINNTLYNKYNLKIEVVTQEDEAYYTALGCYNDINYNKNICVFIGGRGSIEVIFVKNKKILDKKYYSFGVVDITNKFDSLKEDIPTIDDINIDADVLILAGGDHLYWYNNAEYELLSNNILFRQE